jgi:Mrp family chromosome partitioning ATPase
MNEATQSIDLGTSPGVQAGEGALDVLVSGAMRPPNPGKLTGSSTMQALMDQARSTYDLVVIDAPPLIAISDAFSLLGKVDGVVIVGRVRHSRRDLAERLRQVLASSGAPLLGVIANGVKSSLLGSRVYAAGDDPSPRLPPVNSNGASSGEFLPTVKT